MTVLFSAGASEIFTRLPKSVQLSAARKIELLTLNPQMDLVRSRSFLLPDILSGDTNLSHIAGSNATGVVSEAFLAVLEKRIA